MSEKAGKEDLIAFGDFLDHLRAKGFVIGVDQQLRFEVLLGRIGGQCIPQQLRTLLCPIIAGTAEEQRRFYYEFDRYLQILAWQPPPPPSPLSPEDEEEPAVAPPVKAQSRRRSALRATTMVALLVFLTLFVQVDIREPEQVPGRDDIIFEPVWDPSSTQAEIITIITPTVEPPPPTPESPDRRSLWRVLAILPPLAGFLIWLLWRWWRLRPVIEKSQGRRPPFTVPLALGVERWPIRHAQPFIQAARIMRRRQRSEDAWLDLPATIAATVSAQGYPQFRYQAGSRIPEYLILINRLSPRDHQAEWFTALARSLQLSNIPVTIWYYEQDPRVCYPADEKERPRYLAALQRRYPGHRLIIMGDGRCLLKPETGTLDSWAGLLQEWTERAILTPLDPGDWNYYEEKIGEAFPIFPATLAGLASLAQQYELPLQSENWGRVDRRPPDVTYGVTLPDLESYLGPEGFRWLAACSFYPELHWDLTLNLRRRLFSNTTKEGDEAILRRFLRLPWFREGAIPDEIRLQLFLSLHKTDPKLARQIHQYLLDILKSRQVEEGTFAADERRLDIAVQKAWMAKDRRERRNALREVEHLSPGEIQRDYAMVRLIQEKPTSLLAIILPLSFRKYFYPEGLPIYPVKWWAGLVVSVLVALTLLGGVEGIQRYRASVEKQGNDITRNPADSVDIELVKIPAGSFVMGSPPDEEGRYDDEGPTHRVTIPEFWMGRYEVTQRQWRAVMGANPSEFKGDDLPVETVSWDDAREFCRKLEALTGRKFRLPTEAEWEYAARAGTTTPFAFGASLSSEQANFNGNYPYGGAQKGVYREKTTTVGRFNPNQFGLYDMHGNVWEWVEDIWHGNYEGAPTDGSAWVSGSNSSRRVLRGGSWSGYGDSCRSAVRLNRTPDTRDYYLGFRVVVGERAP